MKMYSAVLHVDDLRAGYGNNAVISNVSFSVDRSEIVCIVGESGCGKSTLLKAIIGVDPTLKYFGGHVVMDGKHLNALPLKERKKQNSEHIGMVFQNPGAAFNPIRIYRKQFIETLRSHNKYQPERFEKDVEEAFSSLSLSDYKRILDSCPYEMSGGMNQRIALCLAILIGQEILLADEPTSSLDATIQLQVAQELKNLRDFSDIAQIIVTHNLALARFLADSIGVMYAGRIVEYGPADEIIENPLHPYTKGLISAILSLSGKMPAGLGGQPKLTGPADSGCEFSDRCIYAEHACFNRNYRIIEVSNGHFVSCAL